MPSCRRSGRYQALSAAVASFDIQAQKRRQMTEITRVHLRLTREHCADALAIKHATVIISGSNLAVVQYQGDNRAAASELFDFMIANCQGSVPCLGV